jgi:hypothetical protein
VATLFSVALSVTKAFLPKYPPLSGGRLPYVARTFLSRPKAKAVEKLAHKYTHIFKNKNAYLCLNIVLVKVL